MSRILIVDDRLDVRVSLEAMLELEGHELVMAENGKEALEILSRDMAGNPYDLIITDVMMPEIDGIELMSAINNGYQEAMLPVMVISGGGYNMAADDLLNAASKIADHVLRKPFTTGELIEAVNYLLEHGKKEHPETD